MFTKCGSAACGSQTESFIFGNMRRIVMD
uniref:Uncharacterized protein n=1 Tax=Zea mays TaxID=4577 RepID=C0PBA4_MAIZE|nr:unknown [Zea mays]